MNVKDLIAQLQTCNQEAEVLVISANYGLGDSLVSVSFVHQTNEGFSKTKTFRDAFDYETYTKEVWEAFGGKEPIVYLV